MGIFGKKKADKKDDVAAYVKLMVSYDGGHPEMPTLSPAKKIGGGIHLRMMERHIQLEPATAFSKSWFESTAIDYADVYGINIVEGTGGVRNIIKIDYHDVSHGEIQVRFENVAYTKSGQEAGGVEITDCIRNYKLAEMFRTKTDDTKIEVGEGEVAKKLQKLVSLKEQGLISENDFNEKKKALLDEL